MASLSGGNEIRNLGADELFKERTRFFQEFMDANYGDNVYKEKIRKMLAAKERRLIVNINHVREYNREYADGLLESPMDYLPPFDKALKETVLTLQNPLTEKLDDEIFYVGLEGSFGNNFINPRQVSSLHLGKLVSIEGIITRCSLVRPKVARSVHYSEKMKMFITREYRDGTSLENPIPTSSTYPKEDEQGNALTTEFGFSSYRDYQTISLQEMPERAPAGQLPRPLDVILHDDLVDRVKPGDRVRLIGVYRSLGKHAASVSAIFKTVILANNIQLLSKEASQPVVNEKDIQDIRKISKRENVFELLSSSLAPSIYGHDYIKKAILLLLLGGCEKNLANGTHLRGDINMLLIGDPSTAKSQMLRFVLNIAPLAIATTGRGSSGVGLTAAVTTDKETGERALEAGAMVLADRGVVCIDEFDKMNEIDRVAIHEVMEQQTVTIAKAGIHTSLNARCSVLAAANPAYGHYLVEKPPHENILLPDSLLSRFDLVFVVLDTTDDELNRMISEHVARVHRYIPPGLEEGAPIIDAMQYAVTGDRDDENRPTEVFQKYNKLLHVGIQPEETTRRGRRRKNKVELLSLGFLKKYLLYAKSRMKPVLTQEAADFIAQEYSELRAAKEGEGDKYRTMPITARTLETLIRLSTAHAKARLSQTVEQVDAEIAVEILKFALYKEVKTKKRSKKARTETQPTSDTESEMDSDDSDGEYRNTRTQRSTARSTRRQPTSSTPSIANPQSTEAVPNSPVHDGSSENLTNPSDQMETDDASGATIELSQDRFERFRSILHNLREARGADAPLMVHDIVEHVNASVPGSQVYEVSEVKQALRQMSERNTLWYKEEEETVFFL